ncbi:hypothetical protein J2T12_000154 [Paenibacillus anaericanus]|uniref:hypothetical protein n=1 Tax=Paenibacillus anaericanus TaxID=170367 RepID=UPI00277F92FB|nr:hypothetical protein [Paenibacillus anaericanus]MDQ0086760.1 hypothetical protein [Paenibacillus anaericanus]
MKQNSSERELKLKVGALEVERAPKGERRALQQRRAPPRRGQRAGVPSLTHKLLKAGV